MMHHSIAAVRYSTDRTEVAKKQAQPHGSCGFKQLQDQELTRTTAAVKHGASGENLLGPGCPSVSLLLLRRPLRCLESARLSGGPCCLQVGGGVRSSRGDTKLSALQGHEHMIPETTLTRADGRDVATCHNARLLGVRCCNSSAAKSGGYSL
jgi:hypothetical protein